LKMHPWSFVLPIAPATKKTSQQILHRRGGQPFVAPSAKSGEWEKAAALHLRSAWAQIERKPVDEPVNLQALFYRKELRGDLVNYLQALCDALERAGVVSNDRLITSFDGSRLLHDPACPRIEIILGTLDEPTPRQRR